MREIKFRAWDKENKKMFLPREGSPIIIFINGGITHHYSLENNDEALNYLSKLNKHFKPCIHIFDSRNYDAMNRYDLMQYTGLRDKVGKDIYEGDIVSSVPIEGEEPRINVVQWFNTPYTAAFNFGSAPACHLSIVIGNIYENPELLDVKGVI